MNVNKPILVTDLNIQMDLIMLCFPNITQTVRLVVYVYTQKQLYRIHILPKHQSSIEYTCTMNNIYNVRFTNLYNSWVIIN